jgi:hypothetical protein
MKFEEIMETRIDNEKGEEKSILEHLLVVSPEYEEGKRYLSNYMIEHYPH